MSFDSDTTDKPQIGLGVTVHITPPSGHGSNINVLKVTGLKLPTLTGKDVETTGMSDSADTYMPGYVNHGEAEIDVIYLMTQSAELQALLNVDGTGFAFHYPDGREKSFSGFINSFSEDVPLKDKIANKLKIRATSDTNNTTTAS